MRYRGAVNYYVNLPSNPTPGDVWVVRYQGTTGTVPNGHAYCWEEAPVSSEKTYIGDIPAYVDIINHNPDIVNWLKSKEQRDLAWAAFTFGYGIFFMTPNSSAYLNTESQLNKRGNFLYPLVFNTGSYLCFRKSQLAEQYTQYNADIYGFDYRDYNSIHKILDESSNNIYREYMSRTWSADASYKVVLNGVTYNPYYFNFYNVSHSLSSRPDNGQPSYINWVNGLSSSSCADVDIMVHGSIDQIQPANFVSNRLLLDVNGNIVQPSSSTYTYAYAGIEEELQWVDLGNLAETLPADKGCIYYNGICYSAGGFNMGDYFSRTKPAVTTSNLQVFENGTTVINPSLDLKENLILNNGGNLNLQGVVNENSHYVENNYISLRGATFSNSGDIDGNIIILSSTNNEWNSTSLIASDLYLNFIQVGGHISVGNLYRNFIFDQNPTIDTKGGNLTCAFIAGSENKILLDADDSSLNLYEPILIGAYNEIYSGGQSIDNAFTLIGKANKVYRQYDQDSSSYAGSDSGYCTAVGAFNKISGYQAYAYGYENIVGYGSSNMGSGSSSYSGALGVSNTVINSYESWNVGYYNHLNTSGYSVLLGVSGNSIDCYEIANVGYENRILASGYGYGIGTSNTMAGAYECGISGYYNTIETTIEDPQGYSGHNYGVYYSHVLGTFNRAKDTSGAWLFGYSNQSTGDQYMALIGFNNISESYATGTSYGRTNYRTNNCGALIGYYNQVHASENGSCNYPYIFGANNHINSNLQYVYHTYIIGEGNNSTDSTSDTYIIGDFNTTNNTKNVYLLGSHITITNTNNAIRLGFVPLINDDFFAIGDGTRVYNESTYEWDETPHSIIRIDSSKNIYLNSTVPTPPIPTTNGTYALNVLNGASSWVSGGGGGSTTLAGLTDVSLTTLTDGQILVYDSTNSVWVNSNNSGGGSNVPDKPLNDGNYKLTIESGTAAWTVISGSGSINLPDAPLVDGVYQLDVTSSNPSWVPYVAPTSDLPSKPSSDGVYLLGVSSGVPTWNTYIEPTEVVANPSGTASADLSSLEVGSTIYSIPQGTNVTANPVASATDTLTKLEVGSTVYEVSQGTEVEANPSGSATDTLNSIQIGSTVYEIPSGSVSDEGTIGYNENVTIPAGSNIVRTFEELGITEQGYYLVGMASKHAETTYGWKWFGYLSYSGQYTSNYQSSYIKAIDYNDSSVTMQESAETLTFANTAGQWALNYNIQVMPLHAKVEVKKHAYSTTEQVVGTWIDGKTIYENTYRADVSSNTSGQIQMPNTVSQIIRIEGFVIQNTTNNEVMVNFCNDSTDKANVYYRDSDKTIQIRTGITYGMGIYYLTVQYTKTT